MSLFHFQEWYSNQVDEARYITTAQLIGGRDQVIIGALDGNIVIVDPGKDIESRHEVAVLIEKRLPHPVLQILVGRFLASYDENLLAVLHPKILAFYRLSTADEEIYTVERIFEHKLSHGPAYNMCLGEFSRQQFSQIYVQTLNCSLSIYEGENHLLDRQLLTAIHPGPIVYAPLSKCLYNASGGFLACYPFHSFTSTTSNQQKKLNYDWSFNLGDTAIEIAEIDVTPVQPSILVLCKRILFCVTHGGAPRFVIRLQAVATSLCVYKTSKFFDVPKPKLSTASVSDPIIQLVIGLSTKTMLFYRDTALVWSAQLDFVPTSMLLASFSNTLVGMFSVLSDECKMVVGYLGTEPSLFRMPMTETRFIDFEQRRREMEQFEQVIKQNAREGGAANIDSPGGLEISASAILDVATMAYDTFDNNVPSATINVKLTSSAHHVDLVFQSEVFAHCELFSLSPSNYSDIPITVFVREIVRDPRFRLVATTNSGESAVLDSHVPLKLLCQETGSQRNAQIKLSIDSTGGPLSIADLYSDFEAENQISLGLQPFGSHSVVSVFSAGKNSRYRVQSDSSEFLFLVFDDLVRRLMKKQPDAQLNCPVPLHLFVTAIGEHVDLEKRHAAEMKELERISIQMRHVETVLLNKLKAERDEAMTPINVLINYTYRELLTTMDRVEVTEDQLKRHKNETLKPLLNLMQIVMQLSGIKVPFDGRILDGSEQTLTQRLAPLLGGYASINGAMSQNIDAAELTRLLISFCEQGGRLSGIAEEPNEEEEIENERANEEMKNLPGQELVTLETGALGVSNDMLELIDSNLK